MRVPDSPYQLTIEAAWRGRIATGELKFDAAQEEAVSVLQAFAGQLGTHPPQPQGLFARLIKRLPSGVVNGLYLYGDVGRGKTMLMDMFFATIPYARKRRVHFHSFMLEVHERLHRLQQSHANEVLPGLAREMAKETGLLCFDEFHVSNIADAMILGRLFSALFQAGVVIVAT